MCRLLASRGISDDDNPAVRQQTQSDQSEASIREAWIRNIPTDQIGGEGWSKTFSDAHRAEFEQPHQVDKKEPILRMFRQANWSKLCRTHGLEQPMSKWLRDTEFGVSDDFYRRIRPALVLATRFIGHSRAFFDTIWGSEIDFTELPNGNEHVFLLENSKNKEKFADMWNDKVLDEISNFQIFLGHAPADEPENGSHAYIHYGTHPQMQAKRIRTAALHLSQDFTTFFEHPQYHEWPQQKKDRILFLLAVTIAHETMHLCWRFRWMTRIDDEPRHREEEPCHHKDDPERELGYAWEEWAFGGLIFTTSLEPPNDTHGEMDDDHQGQDQGYTHVADIGAMPWQDKVSRGYNSNGYRFLPINPDLLTAMFDPDIWRSGVRPQDKTVNHDILTYVWQARWRKDYEKYNKGAKCPEIPVPRRQWVDYHTRIQQVQQLASTNSFGYIAQGGLISPKQKEASQRTATSTSTETDTPLQSQLTTTAQAATSGGGNYAGHWLALGHAAGNPNAQTAISTSTSTETPSQSTTTAQTASSRGGTYGAQSRALGRGAGNRNARRGQGSPRRRQQQ